MVLAILLLVVGSIFIVASKVLNPEASRNAPKLKKSLGAGGLGVVAFGGIVLAISLAMSFFYVVNPGIVGVEVLFGKTVKFSESGLKVKNPFSEIIYFDTRTVKMERDLEGASQDLQKVDMKIGINYRINFEKIADLYNKVGKDFEAKVIEPAILSLSKASVSKFKVEDVIVKRTELSELIYSNLQARLLEYYIILENVNINNIAFSPEFSKVVEDKQIAEQQIKTAEYNRQKAENDKKTTILQAEAEATKQRLLKENTSSAVISLKWIEKWDGKLPTYSMGNAIPMINFSKAE